MPRRGILAGPTPAFATMTSSLPAAETLAQIARAISAVIRGKDDALRLILAAFASGGHVLLEDLPGAGKTTLAKALAQATGIDYRRVQFTPDLLPSDILGVSVFDPREQGFHFHPGPIFTQLLLADEINRASPRTQSALLEAMAEGQVTLEGKCHVLADPFFVIATQNPVDFRGTYPLPEAQMDRFALRLSLGYLAPAEEVAMLADQQTSHPLASLQACASPADVQALRVAASRITVSAAVREYIVALVGATRAHADVAMGASPRASLALMKTAQALALLAGRDFVTPDDVQTLAVPVIAHRLALDAQARYAGREAGEIVRRLLETVPVPR